MKLFSSERTVIQTFKEKDIDSFIKYHNNEEWMKFQGFKNLTKKEYEEELFKDIDLELGNQFAINQIGTELLVGDIFLKVEKNSLLIGYTIAPEFSKKGYATEVITELIKWANQKQFETILAYVDVRNQASINLLKKVGFIEVPHSEEEGETLFRFSNI